MLLIVSFTAVGCSWEREVPTSGRPDRRLLQAQPWSHGDHGPGKAADFPHRTSLD